MEESFKISQEYKEKFIRDIRMKLAKRIYVAAELLQKNLKSKLATAYPPASRKGEYPRARTYSGQKSVVIYPELPQQIAIKLYTDVGYLKNAFYMGVLEEKKGRKGLLSLYKEMRPQITAVLKGEKADVKEKQ